MLPVKAEVVVTLRVVEEIRPGAEMGESDFRLVVSVVSLAALVPVLTVSPEDSKRNSLPAVVNGTWVVIKVVVKTRPLLPAVSGLRNLMSVVTPTFSMVRPSMVYRPAQEPS